MEKVLPDQLVKSRVLALHAYTLDEPECRLKLNQNESPYDFPDELKEEVLRQVRDRDWNRYPGLRPWKLQEKLANRLGVPADWVAVANGSNELLQGVSLMLLNDRAKVLYCPPTFGLYPHLAAVTEAQPVEVPLTPNLTYNLEGILEAFKAYKPALTLLASPNNPTGTWLTPEEVRVIASEAPGAVLLDEAYYQFAPESIFPLLAEFENLLIMRTLSKAFRLAGVRIGYLVGHPKWMHELNKTILPFHLDIFSQAVASVFLDHESAFEATIREAVVERERLFEALSSFPALHPWPSAANFILFDTDPSLDLYRRLLDKGILIRNFKELRPGRHWLRVSAGTPEENETFLKTVRGILGA